MSGSQAQRRIRSTITVERPAVFCGGMGWCELRNAETWRIIVVEERFPWRKDYTTIATMLRERRSHGDIVIPGVRLGPETFDTLPKARKRARGWADVLSGKLWPDWVEVRS